MCMRRTLRQAAVVVARLHDLHRVILQVEHHLAAVNAVRLGRTLTHVLRVIRVEAQHLLVEGDPGGQVGPVASWNAAVNRSRLGSKQRHVVVDIKMMWFREVRLTDLQTLTVARSGHLTRTPPVEAAPIPVTTPNQPQCKHAHLYRSASAPGWLTPYRVSTTPTSTTPTVTRQPASPSVSPAGQPRPPSTTLRHRQLWF